MNRSGRIIELDGLRGLAVVSVVLAHYFGEVSHRIGVFDLGWLGVDLFFVLSGFLIGGILIDNRGSTNFSRRSISVVPFGYFRFIIWSSFWRLPSAMRRVLSHGQIFILIRLSI